MVKNKNYVTNDLSKLGETVNRKNMENLENSYIVAGKKPFEGKDSTYRIGPKTSEGYFNVPKESFEKRYASSIEVADKFEKYIVAEYDNQAAEKRKSNRVNSLEAKTTETKSKNKPNKLARGSDGRAVRSPPAESYEVVNNNVEETAYDTTTQSNTYETNQESPQEEIQETIQTSTGRSIDDFVLDVPSFDFDSFSGMKGVGIKEYFKVAKRAEKLYSIQRSIERNKSDFSDEELGVLSKVGASETSKLKGKITQYQIGFDNYTKAVSAGKLDLHSKKEEAEFKLFQNQESLSDMKEDYTTMTNLELADSNIANAKESVNAQTKIAYDSVNALKSFSQKNIYFPGFAKVNDYFSQKVDWTNEKFTDFSKTD